MDGAFQYADRAHLAKAGRCLNFFTVRFGGVMFSDHVLLL
jgi:hypothetical protein